MIYLEIDNFYSYINTDQETLNEFIKLYSFKDPNYYRTPEFRRGAWDGIVKFITPKGRIKTGLVPFLLQEIEKRNIEFKYIDNRRNLDIKPELITKFSDKKLREYQERIVEECLNRKVKKMPWNRGIIYAATNAGKTLMTFAIYHCYNTNHKNIRMLFVAHRKLIIDQVEGEIKKHINNKVGQIRGKEVDLQQVTVGMIQSINNLLKHKPRALEDKFDILIIDECHRATAPTYENMIKKVNAAIIFGLSGTPFKDNDPIFNNKLLGNIGPTLSKVKNKFLIDKGFSAKCHINILPVPSRISDKKFDELELKSLNIYNNIERDRMLFEIIKTNPDKQILIAVTFEEHGLATQKNLKKWGIKTPFISSKSKDIEREKVIKDLRSEKLKVLISSMILQEGFDHPNIEILVIYWAGSSKTQILQYIGRGIREKTKDKENLLTVFDFADSFSDKAKAQSKKRYKIYNQQKFKILEAPNWVKSKEK